MADEARLQELLSRWQQLCQQGRTITVEELCADCPELAGELERRVRILTEPTAAPPTDPPTRPASDPEATPQVPTPLRGIAGAVEMPWVPSYEILGKVGHGGMGVVYKARHKRLDRQVAIKVTLPGADADRFLREARLLARIKSPYVVTVHDFDVPENGCPVIVMEWVEGTTLARVLQTQGGPVTEADGLPWMRQTCAGMLAAAEQGIIHRDLKPSNLLIDAQGCVRVADFGLARGPTMAGELTQSHQMMGTPYYMAPEQAEDPHSVDTRADVYSFGATFYHALTGVPAFDGATAFSVLYKHKTEPLIAPRTRNPALSERTSEILERCLAKSPGDRFSSFAEILRVLQPTESAASPWEVSDDAELAPYLTRYRARRDAYLSERTAWEQELDVYSFPRGQTLRVVRGDIVRQPVKALVIRYENSWWDIGGRGYEAEVATGIISEYELGRQVSGRKKGGSVPPCWVCWSPRFQQSLNSGNLKKLDLERLFSLRLPTSQRMYRFLDKRFYPPHQPPPVEMDLHDFACGHIGLTRVDNVAELKRRLAPAIEELEGIGFIAKVEPAERYQKVKTGIWRVRFRAGPQFRGQGAGIRDQGSEVRSQKSEIRRTWLRR